MSTTRTETAAGLLSRHLRERDGGGKGRKKHVQRSADGLERHSVPPVGAVAAHTTLVVIYYCAEGYAMTREALWRNHATATIVHQTPTATGHAQFVREWL